MTRRWATLAMLVALAGAAVNAGGQAPAAAGSIKRTADGKPNIAGVWQSGGVSLTGERGRGPALPPPAYPPPPREALAYQPWAAEKNKQLGAVDDPIAHCLLPGVPRIITMPMPLEIVQTPTRIIIQMTTSSERQVTIATQLCGCCMTWPPRRLEAGSRHPGCHGLPGLQTGPATGSG